MNRCPTLCDADCNEVCHEVHVVRWRRAHQPIVCPAITGMKAAGREVAAHDIPPEAFPLTIEMFRVDTREVVWTKTVAYPQGVEIPALRKEIGVPVGVRLSFGDGRIEEHE